MSTEEIDAYVAALEEPKRSTLRELRRTILDIVPDAEECLSYRMPAFRLRGKVIAGFAAFKNHLSYLPTHQPKSCGLKELRFSRPRSEHRMPTHSPSAWYGPSGPNVWTTSSCLPFGTSSGCFANTLFTTTSIAHTKGSISRSHPPDQAII